VSTHFSQNILNLCHTKMDYGLGYFITDTQDPIISIVVNNLVKVYSRDLEEILYDELKQFIGMVKVKEDNKLIKKTRLRCYK